VNLNAQSWQSISKIGTFETAPYRQFSIDPYRNNIWFVNDTKVSVLENSGAIHVFTSSELGSLWSGDQLQFAFTPNHIYYARDYFGLYSFDGYISQEEYPFTGYQGKIRSSGGESVFILQVEPYTTYVEFNEAFVDNPYRGAYNMAVKNNFMYVSFSSNSNIAYYTAPGTSDYAYIHTDQNYVGGNYNEMKFSRFSDTLYVAGKKGISYAYNYDFLDTITPNNTINMPSPNVLEIEFDDKDSLWAVFGDVNDTPFALAKLEGNAWTNRFDNSNSPIDFSNFYGLEIDTLGNLWVADLNYLHTFLTPNSPTWLGLHDNGKANQFNLFPNPATTTFTISGIPASTLGEKATLKDLSGKIVMEFELNEQNQLVDVSQLRKGIYLLQIGESTQKISIE
jgi:hypothetical protein